MNKSTKRIYIFLFLGCSIPISLFFGFKFLNGYYPIPTTPKILYYAIRNDIKKLPYDIIDESFTFSEKGYIAKKKISSPYAIEHSLSIKFRNKLPVDHSLSMVIKMELMKDDNVIYSEIISSGKNIW